MGKERKRQIGWLLSEGVFSDLLHNAFLSFFTVLTVGISHHVVCDDRESQSERGTELIAHSLFSLS